MKGGIIDGLGWGLPQNSEPCRPVTDDGLLPATVRPVCVALFCT
jgi:hypothetical protein